MLFCPCYLRKSGGNRRGVKGAAALAVGRLRPTLDTPPAPARLFRAGAKRLFCFVVCGIIVMTE